MREIENPSRLLFNGLVAENAQHRLADPTRTSHEPYDFHVAAE